MVEMLGSLEPLSRHLLPPHLRHAPTRIEVTLYISTSRYLSTSHQVGPGLWARVPAHPGLHARGRYGPGYLYHVQVTELQIIALI